MTREKAEDIQEINERVPFASYAQYGLVITADSGSTEIYFSCKLDRYSLRLMLAEK
jgi:hypothetical protein